MQQGLLTLGLVILGLLLEGAAVWFGLRPGVQVYYRSPSELYVTDPSPGGAACGLGIAGGLCFVGAALIAREMGEGTSVGQGRARNRFQASDVGLEDDPPAEPGSAPDGR